MANPKKNEGDNTWAWGVDGWYCARNGWNDKYTKDLQDMGYVVVKAFSKPEESVYELARAAESPIR